MVMEEPNLLPNEMFSHEPLDHNTASIRLVRLDPELSPDGLIQCTIVHDTIEASYTCLSYRWGAPHPSSLILINGKRFCIRQNLLDFLDMARQSPEATDIYWIDALCIDQANTAERNHQVSQMGQIFSRADCVYLWLGANKELAPVLRALQDPEAATLQQWNSIHAHSSALQDYICGNEYWERAWIVQEIFLARTVIVWADAAPILFEYLHWSIDYFYIAWRNRGIERFKLSTKGSLDQRRLITKFEEAKSLYHGASLVALLMHFHDMKCEVPRDRIFSLISLCAEGHDYQVDYDGTDTEACVNILKQCDAVNCLCTPSLVADSIGVDNAFRTQDESKRSILEVEMTGVAFKKSFETYQLEGHSYIVKRLAVNWEFYMSIVHGPPPCESIVRLLRYIFEKRQIVKASDTPNEQESSGEFQGRIRLPANHTLSSFLQEHESIWVGTNDVDRDGVPLYERVDSVSIKDIGSDTCLIRILLSTLPDLVGYSPTACPKIKLGRDTSDRTTGIVKIRLDVLDSDTRHT
jgi:hypothetical protein